MVSTFSRVRKFAARSTREGKLRARRPPMLILFIISPPTCNKALCMLSVLINTHLVMAAKDAGVDRFFYASSACVYAADKQTDPNVTALEEEDAYPAMPEDGYGWEKLCSESMCRHCREDFGVAQR